MLCSGACGRRWWLAVTRVEDDAINHHRALGKHDTSRETCHKEENKNSVWTQCDVIYAQISVAVTACTRISIQVMGIRTHVEIGYR
jgi:hypothetical protein